MEVWVCPVYVLCHVTSKYYFYIKPNILKWYHNCRINLKRAYTNLTRICLLHAFSMLLRHSPQQHDNSYSNKTPAIWKKDHWSLQFLLYMKKSLLIHCWGTSIFRWVFKKHHYCSYILYSLRMNTSEHYSVHYFCSQGS